MFLPDDQLGELVVVGLILSHRGIKLGELTAQPWQLPFHMRYAMTTMAQSLTPVMRMALFFADCRTDLERSE